MENNNNQEVINLSEIVSIIKRHLIKIVVVAAISAVIIFLYTKIFVPNQYASSGKIIVNNRRTDGGSITNDELNSAKGLTAVYSIVIKSDPIMNRVIENLKMDISTSELQSMITVSSVDGTQIMNISVISSKPELSEQIVNEILKVAPEDIILKVEAGSVNIISPATLNPVPIAPNALRNALLIFIVTILGVSGFFIFSEMLDKTIKSPEDIEKELGYPILGIIPNVESVRGGTK